MDEVVEALEKYHGLVPLVYDIETMSLDEARPEDMQTAVYLKREADKVIAELEKHIADGDKDFEMADHQNERLLKIVRHHKYRRCLAMVKWCESKVYHIRRTPLGDMSEHEYWQYENDFWQRWQKRWLELAEKFKEAK